MSAVAGFFIMVGLFVLGSDIRRAANTLANELRRVR
jgi:hypothetical protein